MPYNNEHELYHYGVKGMKWGVRKNRANADAPVTPSRRTLRLQKAVDRQKKVVDSWKDTTPIKGTLGYGEILSRKDCEDIAEAAAKRLAKLEYKHLVSQRADKINAGESAVGRIYNKITGADTIQAEIELDIEKRAKVNKAWRD